jgi:excisionase family DNA binding protein
MSDETNNLLSVTETAKRLGVIRQRVFQLIQSGKLPAVMVGSQYVVKETDLELVKDRKTGRPPKVPDKEK